MKKRSEIEEDNIYRFERRLLSGESGDYTDDKETDGGSSSRGAGRNDEEPAGLFGDKKRCRESREGGWGFKERMRYYTDVK